MMSLKSVTSSSRDAVAIFPIGDKNPIEYQGGESTSINIKKKSMKEIRGDSPPTNLISHQEEKNRANIRSYSSGTKLAVKVSEATKSFGSRKNKVVVLNKLDMNVLHGSIYGLLGPSGCGKTTLLGCLVSRLKLDKGKICLFGFSPGSNEAAVPGSRVGYMPQEIALYKEFTIVETLEYFGRIHCLPKEVVASRVQFLVHFLNLPDPNRIIDKLSGGQQRRVSLAAALLQEPQLLILDEPTVGADPLLRSSIWKHLQSVSTGGNTTIIITTHYIEEARQADRVGLMRNGKLLAETSPSSLLEHFRMNSLETVFLKLCLQEGDIDKQDTSSIGEINEAFEDMPMEVRNFKDDNTNLSEDAYGYLRSVSHHEEEPLVQAWPHKRKTNSFSLNRLGALIIKNFIRLRRNLGFLIFAFCLPPIQVILFCVAIGGVPQDLDVAVVNLDAPTIGDFKISEIYLDNLDSDIIIQEEFDTYSAGYSAVEDGTHWGLVFFNTSYTDHILAEQLGVQDPSGDGQIHVAMDNTNYEISLTIQIELFRGLGRTAKYLMQMLPFSNDTSLTLPIQIEDPVYGEENPTFTEFMAPGVILTICFFMAVSLTALSFIIERKEGLLDRSWVSGVQVGEVMLAHLLTQMLVMLIQIALILIFMFGVFNIPCEGSMALVILLSVLQGLAGMSLGLMISALFDEELTAIEVTVGLFYPLLLLSGIVWPVEAMPTGLRYISYALPQTLACEAMRAILYRGWGLSYFEVYIGYIVTCIWLFSTLTVAALAIKLRK